MHKEYYRGGRWWLPLNLSRDEFCESVYAHGLFVYQEYYNYALTNLLFGLCKLVWIVDPLVILLNPYFGTPTCPFYPKVLRAKKCIPTTSFIVFIVKLAFESYEEFEGVSEEEKWLKRTPRVSREKEWPRVNTKSTRNKKKQPKRGASKGESSRGIRGPTKSWAQFT